MGDPKIKRVLMSVTDKTGIVDFARALSEEFGAEIACGLLALSGNTNAAVYQMLRK